MPNSIAAIILAAGKGTRMNSSKPKVLHKLAGLPLIGHVLSSVGTLNPEIMTVVIGPEQDEIKQFVDPVNVVYQTKPLGTGHAVKSALESLINFDGTVFVAFGADPLISPETLQKMLLARQVNNPPDIVVMGFKTKNPGRYGRLLQDPKGRLERIIEVSEADKIDRPVRLYNGGVMAIDGTKLGGFLEVLKAENAKKEYYLTDIIGISRDQGGYAEIVEGDEAEALGIDTRQDLAMAEGILQSRLRAKVMASGVTLIAPETVCLSHDTVIGRDTTIHPNVVFGEGVKIGENVEVKSFSHIEGAKIDDGATLGPFARLRSGAEISSQVHVGNFVEIKEAKINEGAKIGHLSYVGDAIVGANANLGAGTITCNFDGFEKHTTSIGANAFIGSNTALVAPIKIGDNAIVGAGSAITRLAPDDTLVVARGETRQITGGASRFRSKRQNKKKID